MDFIKTLVEIKTKIKSVKTLNELNELKSSYLGKKSQLQEAFKTFGSLSDEAKKILGAKINDFKLKVNELCDNKREEINLELINEKLKEDALDLTLSLNKEKGSIHPLEKTRREIEDLFISLGFNIFSVPLVELDKYNFEALNLPKDHPAREMQDSFYIDKTHLLRTHTSPVQVREMLKNKGKPLKIICPGKVFRRDNDDATHSHEFNQIEGLVIGSDVTMSDLKGTLLTFCKRVFGKNLSIRLRPSYFPFTEPSVEVDVECFKCQKKGCELCKGSGFIEVLGAGMVHPNVLTMSGYDPDKVRGFAFGMGLERVTMLKYGIDDIRAFYNSDLRFLKNFRR